ncbi:unnamed protein product, partial [Ixodes pacificus]
SSHNHPSSINVLQHNCNHSSTATEHLRITQNATDTYISLLQEPYYHKNKIIGFAITDTILQYHTQPRVAIIIHSKSFDIHAAYTSRDIIAVRLKKKNTFFFFFFFSPPPPPPRRYRSHTYCPPRACPSVERHPNLNWR